MDSLTQGLLGAATFALVKDKDLGSKSLLLGAAAGTLPDLDIFLSPFYDKVMFYTVHRGFSHSIFFAVLVSVGLGEFFYRRYGRAQSRVSWNLAFFLAVFTHSLLDTFTTYGTQLLNPWSNELYSFNSIHVIEPTYTLILLTGTYFLLKKNQKRINRGKVIRLSLVLSSCFLAWTLVSKKIAEEHFVDQLEAQGIQYSEIMVSPTPFNSLFWHGIVKADDGFYFGSYSLIDRRPRIEFSFRASQQNLLAGLTDPRIDSYLHYTAGMALVEPTVKDRIKVFAVKFGPVNVVGDPEFIYPMVINLGASEDEQVYIERTPNQRGPIKNYRNFFRRIFLGNPNP